MLRSRISPLVCCFLLVLVTTAPAAPGDYTFQTIDLPFQGAAFPPLVWPVAVTDALTFAGDASVPGGLGFRIAQTLNLTPVRCPDFARYPFSDRRGPEVVGMNNAGVVALNYEGLENQCGGVQTPDGTCTFTLVEGSVGTRYTGISNAGVVVGYYWNNVAGPELGLLRFHGFFQVSSGVHRLDGPNPNDIVFPTGINSHGIIIGTMLRNVQPDNSAAAEQAFFRTPDGVYHDVEGPDGELVTLTGLNDNGQAVGTFTAAAGGQQAFVFDTTTATLTILPRPTADTVELLPTAINNSGDIVGAYGEGTPEFPRVSVHGFLALPTGREHQ